MNTHKTAGYGLKEILRMDALAAGPRTPPAHPALAGISSIPDSAQRWLNEQGRSAPKAILPGPVRQPVRAIPEGRSVTASLIQKAARDSVFKAYGLEP